MQQEDQTDATFNIQQCCDRLHGGLGENRLNMWQIRSQKNRMNLLQFIQMKDENLNRL